MRRAAKIDKNHKEIVEALRRYGCSVLSLAAVGKGCPDLLVGRAGRQHLLEVKSDKGSLTGDQIYFISQWKGSVHVVRSPEDAINVIQSEEIIQRGGQW